MGEDFRRIFSGCLGPLVFEEEEDYAGSYSGSWVMEDGVGSVTPVGVTSRQYSWVK